MGRSRTAGALHLLTTREVLNAGVGDHADGGGLFLRIRVERLSKAGKRLPGTVCWVYRYTAPSGKRREMGLGVVHRGSVAQAGQSITAARDDAQVARDLLRKGVDPLEDRAQRRQAARQVEKVRERWTLARCARDYHERVIEPNGTDKHAAQWISSLENHVPAALWDAPVESITAPQLLEALQGAEAHKSARNVGTLGETLSRVRQRLEAIFEDAQFFGRCPGNPAKAIRRKLTKARPKKKAVHFAYLDYQQAPALLARLRAMQGTAARCLEFAVLTAARTSEALLAEWSELDLAAGVWTVPAGRMKAKEKHVVFLAPRAVDILKAQMGQSDRYVFPSTMPSREHKPMSNMAMLAVLDRLGVRDQTTVHGLCRGTFSTWAAETRAGHRDVVEACLAHKEPDKIRAAYNHAQFNDERRALLLAWAGYLARPALELAA